MKKVESKPKIITDLYGIKKQVIETIETIRPTIIKRIRYNGNLDKIPMAENQLSLLKNSIMICSSEELFLLFEMYKNVGLHPSFTFQLTVFRMTTPQNPNLFN